MPGHRTSITAALLALPLALAAGAPAAASPGGASPDLITLPGAQTIIVRVGNPVVRAEGGGITLAARSTSMVRGRLVISGTAPRGSRSVRIEREEATGEWTAIARAAVRADGSFRVAWRPDRAGPLRIRARAGRRAAETTRVAAPGQDPPRLELSVYRPGVASWYGPTRGTWQTACGVPLLPTTVGVAHRKLPCGTPVAFYYRGRTVVAPVIDRGPFVRGRTWDLTRAAHRALGATDGLITVGALPLPTPATAASPPAR